MQRKKKFLAYIKRKIKTMGLSNGALRAPGAAVISSALLNSFISEASLLNIATLTTSMGKFEMSQVKVSTVIVHLNHFSLESALQLIFFFAFCDLYSISVLILNLVFSHLIKTSANNEKMI